MSDWKDILSDNDKPLDEEELLKYLDDTTSKEDRHAIEEMVIDPFDNDALEGLQQMKNPDQAVKHVKQLKHKLHEQLKNKKNRKRKPKNKDLQWIIFAVVLLLFLSIICFALVRFYH